MEEIANNVYLESGYPGVVLGTLRFEEGLVLIDAPFRLEDQRTWQTNLLHLGGGASKMLVMLDTHIDRTLGVRGMDLIVIGHENSLEILRDRPTTARGQDLEAGADWEPFDLPQNIRWATPDMTYTQDLLLYWDDKPVLLTHHPGSHAAGTWLQYDAEKVLFVGDSIVLNQPPFLAWADIDLWLSDLDLLESDAYKRYTIISGRNGVVKLKSITRMRTFLTSVREAVQGVSDEEGALLPLLEQVPALLKQLSFPKNLTQLYHNRLSWGLEQYIRRQTQPIDETKKGELA